MRQWRRRNGQRVSQLRDYPPIGPARTSVGGVGNLILIIDYHAERPFFARVIEQKAATSGLDGEWPEHIA